MAAPGPPVVAREVVQPLPSAGTDALNGALQRLAANPRDAGALVDAGFAALDIGDVDAAVGFFSRADAVDPGNARAQAGLGAAYVRSENPYDALLMFEEAEKAGVAPVTMAGDRGLAYDLVGDSSSAQMYYRKALALGANPEISRRLAVSLAISGDRAGAEAALLPLLKKQDLAAYRARAFVLAIMGDAKGAQEIADQVMPRDMAGKIAPYLRYMPRLTAAQQAAAANFGQFPRAADIGRDDPRVAKYSGNTKRPQVASAAPAMAAQSALVPAGEPFGRKAESEKPAKAAKQSGRERRDTRRVAAAVQPAAPVAPPVARSVQTVRVTETGELPSIAQTAAAAPSAPVAAQPATSALAAVRAAQTPGFAPATQPVAQSVMGVLPPRATVAAVPPPATPAVSPYAPVPVPRAGEAAIASFDSTRPAAAAAAVSAAAPSVADRGFVGPVDGPVQTSAGVGAGAVAATAAPSPASPAPAAAVVATPTVQPLPAAAPVPEPLPKSLSEAFADFTLPVATARADGAVDITKITPRRETPAAKEVPAEEPKAAKDAKVDPKDAKANPKDAKASPKDAKAKKDAKPKPPAQPSRNWVQVATGRNTDALGFDWRRMTKAQADLFKGRQPYVAKWGQTNRLLTGPFPSASAAQDYVAKLKKAGVDSFTFASAEGEEVTALKTGR